MGFQKKAKDHIPWAADQGVDFLVGSPAATSLQSALVVQAGAAPFSLVFADHGLANMAGSDYVAMVQIEGAAATVDESTKTELGFDVLGGVDTDVINVIIIGRTANQS